MKKLIPLAGALLVFTLGCSKSGATGTYPYFTPPVKAATPSGLAGGSSLVKALSRAHGLGQFGMMSLDPTQFQSRFFNAAGGPTNLFDILESVDNRVSGINSRISNFPCSTSTSPVAYTITPLGQSVTMYAQCSELDGGSGFDQWAQVGTTFYLYTDIGAGEVAAILKPSPTDTTKSLVQAWISVGQTNSPWDSGSYTVMEVSADDGANTFEMTVAGMGIGYCGVQYKSDGTNLYGTGSADMGPTCLANDTICVAASDLSTPATCTGPVVTFALLPVGREGVSGITQASWGASMYPASPNLLFNGTSTDPVHFGPTTPTVTPTGS